MNPQLALLSGLLVLTSIGHVLGFSYLMVLPTAAKSHFHVGQALAKGLVAAGHEVTLISAFPQKKPIERLVDVDVSSLAAAMAGEAVVAGGRGSRSAYQANAAPDNRERVNCLAHSLHFTIKYINTCFPHFHS